MGYVRITQKVFGEPWVITPGAHEAIQRALVARIDGDITNLRAEGLGPRSNHFNAVALGLTAPQSRGSRVYRRGKMAYVPVEGIMGKGLSLMETLCGGYDVNQLQSDIEEISADSSIRNVLFDFDSPGGQVFGIPETARMLAQLPEQGKKTYAYSGKEVQSAAYWLYSQAQNRYLASSAVAGSVGVYMYLLDKSKALEMQGMSPVLIKAGAHKGAGLPGVPLSEEQRGMLQEQVDQIYSMMVKDVNSAHAGISESTLQGQSFLGRQAVKVHLADALLSNLNSLVQRLS